MEQAVGVTGDMAVDENAGETTSLHPRYKSLLRIRVAMVVAALVLAVAVLDIGPIRETPLPFGAAPALAALLALAAILVLPARRYRSWGYRINEEELHIRHGQFVRRRTIMPFGRVQHLDTSQGPIERMLGLATLTMHTAGTRGASVALPGLAHDEAARMRDRIRAEIRQDLV